MSYAFPLDQEHLEIGVTAPPFSSHNQVHLLSAQSQVHLLAAFFGDFMLIPTLKFKSRWNTVSASHVGRETETDKGWKK